MARKKTKKSATKPKGFFYRLVLLECCLLVVAAGILLRAFLLQATEQKSLERLAKKQHERQISIPGDRGAILDRNGSQLATSIPQFSVYVNPQLVSNPYAKATALSKILKQPTSKWLKVLNSERYFAWIKRQTTEQEYQKIKNIFGESVGFVHESRRYYPERQLASHVLGFVGLEGKGLGGIELRYEEDLQGKQREIKITRDARGRAIDLASEMGRQEDLMGNDIVLTIDRRLQFIAERELGKTVKEYRAKSGSVVVLDPTNGDVLALANYPDFDPNLFATSTSESRKNRALTDTIEPGSTFKIFTLARAFASGKIKDREPIFCENGAFRTKGVTIHDVKKHEQLVPSEILKYSSNIGAYKIAESLGAQEFYESILDFGFNEKTGLELGGESRGIVRPYAQWRGATQGSIGFGHGIAVTPIQLVRGFIPFANQGELLRPRLVKMVKSSSGKTIYQAPEKESSGIAIKPAIAEKIRLMMVGVTEAGGTGTMAAVPGFRVAGKTATAQKVNAETGTYSQDHYVSSFVGFIPAEKPRLLIGVFVDDPQGESYGGVVAGPCFRQIAEQGLMHLGVNPTEPRLAPGSPKLAQIFFSPQNLLALAKENIGSAELGETNSPLKMPDIRGLTVRSALKVLEENQVGAAFAVEVEGIGLVYEQSPNPGEDLKALMTSKGQIRTHVRAKPSPEKPFASFNVNRFSLRAIEH